MSKINRASRRVTVCPGDLITVEKMGVQIVASFNEDEGGQPYVSIDTTHLPKHWTYDEKTGLRGSANPYGFELTTEQPYAEWTITGPQGVAAVIRQQEDELDLFALRRVTACVASLNEDWRQSCGLPIISVHLNDGAAIYEDQGQGNTAHLTDQVVERLRRMADDAKQERDDDDARWEGVTQDTEEAEQSGAIAGHAEALTEVLRMLEPSEATA